MNRALGDACELALKHLPPEMQLALMMDASFRSVSRPRTTEVNPEQEIQSKRKTNRPVAFGSELFSLLNSKGQNTRDFFGIQMAFLEFADVLPEATKPTNFSTDNKSVTHFSQTKAIPKLLCNASDYVLQFTFKKPTFWGH